MKPGLWFGVASALVFLLSGCATTDTQPRRGLRVVQEQGDVTVPPAATEVFQGTLNQELFGEDGRFVPGDDLTLRWRATEIDRGSRALRYLVGFGAGRGVFVLKASLFDPAGRLLASRKIKGAQTMGVGGGSYDSAVREAAEDTADFVRDAVAPPRSRRGR